MTSVIPRLYILLLLLVFNGCNDGKSAKDAAARPSDSIAHLTVTDGKGLFFSFFDNRAEMRTVERLAQVAETARAEVMVTSPKHSLPGDLIYVVDLRKKPPAKGYRSWVEAKGTWLDRVMPKASISKKAKKLAEKPTVVAKRTRRRWRRRKKPRRKPRRKPTPKVATAPTPAATPKKAALRVILFSTAWCPSCKTARAFFQQRGIPFQELDVERNQQALQLYRQVAQQARLKPGVVPVIIVGDRVFQGFSRPQIEAALARAAG